MALQQAIEISGTGVFASYWRIRHVTADFPWAEQAADIHVTVEGWVDQAAREAGKAPVPGSSRIYVHQIESFDGASGLTRAELYGFVQSLPEFSGSTDI